MTQIQPGKARCFGDDENKVLLARYHDKEWGVPVHDDRLHFEMLILEGAQAGLSWETVLKRREGYRRAFKGFDPQKVAQMRDDELETLRQDAGIIRNRLKIYAARKNMESTYLEWHEASRSDNLSHHYEGDIDLWGTNLSFDWAGGGLVTTAQELTKFLRGLFCATLFSRQWLSELLTWRSETQWRPHSSARYIRFNPRIG